MVKNLKLIREGRGLSQQALAQALGLTQQTISKYETLGTEPDIETLIRLADHLETTIDILVGREELSGKGASYDFAGSVEEMKVLESYRELRSAQKDAFRRMLDAFCGD